MGVLLDRVTELHRAYEWESNRIAEWIGDMDATPGKGINAVADRFERSWRDYFTELDKSNKAAMKICQDAKSDADADKAIKEINGVFHRKSAIAAILADAVDKEDYSKYFGAVAAALGIEVEARNYIEHYLTTGKI